jgi:hypothetical protein
VLLRLAKSFLVLPGLALVLVLALAACGSVHAGAASSGTAMDTVTHAAAGRAAATAPAGAGARAGAVWRTQPTGENTTTVHLTGSGRVLLVPVQAPFGDRACMRDFTARLTAFSAAAAYVRIDYQAALRPGPDGLAGYGCPPGPVRTVRIHLPGPLGHRQVIINHVETFWYASATRLTLCATWTGAICQQPPPWPPPASCTDASYGQAMGATYPPEHSDYGAVGCDGRWLVLNVGWPGGAAGCDGPSCGGGSTVTHWFFRASKKGWITIASSLTAGCTRVHQVAPRFPTALCAGLPAVGPDAGNQG